jgi:hypothetical protein
MGISHGSSLYARLVSLMCLMPPHQRLSGAEVVRHRQYVKYHYAPPDFPREGDLCAAHSGKHAPRRRLWYA